MAELIVSILIVLASLSVGGRFLTPHSRLLSFGTYKTFLQTNMEGFIFQHASG